MSSISVWPRCHWHWAVPIVVIALFVGSLAPSLAKPVAAASGDWAQFRPAQARRSTYPPPSVSPEQGPESSAGNAEPAGEVSA